MQLQQLTVSGYMKRRFGMHGHRVWRLLLEFPYLQLDAVGKQAMLDVRTTRQQVYALFKAGYVHVQEVPKTSERAPSRSFYLYWTDANSANCQFVADTCTAAGARCRSVQPQRFHRLTGCPERDSIVG